MSEIKWSYLKTVTRNNIGDIEGAASALRLFELSKEQEEYIERKFPGILEKIKSYQYKNKKGTFYK